MPSIHAMEEGLRFEALPPVDPDVRGIGVVRVLAGDVVLEEYEAAEYRPLRSWATEAMRARASVEDGTLTVAMEAGGPGALRTQLSVADDGTLTFLYRWDPGAFPDDARFAPELSFNQEVVMECEPEPEAVWRYDICTVSKSEKGAETSVQGQSVTPRWPAALGEARLVLRPRQGVVG